MASVTFTSSLPDELIRQLTDKARELKLPKNKLIEKALRIYLDQLDRGAYVKSYQKKNDDADVMQIAEEGMEEYIRQIDKI